MRITHNLTIDLQHKVNLKKIDVVQGDTYTRSVRIELYDNGVLWDIPQESSILVRYSKPDGTAGIYEWLPDGSIAGYVEGNTVTVLLAPQMFTCPGRVPTQVSLVVDDQILSTFSFVVDVEVDPSKGAAGSESYFNWKTAFIPQVSNAHVGYYLEIESVDSNGRIEAVKDVPNPAIAAELMALDAKNIALSAEETADSAYANAEMAKELAASAMPQTSGANVGQYLEITAVDSNGRVAGIKGVVNPAIIAELKAQEAKRTALEAEETANRAYANAEMAIQNAAIAKESATSATEKADEALETANNAQNTSARNADDIADLARTKLPQVTGARVGQYIMVTGVDGEGRITAFAPVDAPTSGSIDGDLDMKGNSINGVGSLSFNGPGANVGDGFWIQANYAISKEDGSKTSVVQLFSNDTDDPVIIRNVAPAENNNDVVNLDQLNSAVSGKLDASELPQAVSDALAQAKESGEFDGPQGEKGDPGEQGPQGDPGVYIGSEEPDGDATVWIDHNGENVNLVVAPATAEIGQTIVVKAVDETGKPTVWEAADFPAGGDSGWELIAAVELSESVKEATVSTDRDGNPFQLKKMFMACELYSPSDTPATNLHGFANGVSDNSNAIWYTNANAEHGRLIHVYLDAEIGYLLRSQIGGWTNNIGIDANVSSPSYLHVRQNVLAGADHIHHITVSAPKTLEPGSKIEIYGVKK